jgi:hypothetical protein
MLGYLDISPRSTGNDEKRNYLGGAAATSNDGFAMPAPRQPSKAAASTKLPSLLSSKRSSESDDEDLLK